MVKETNPSLVVAESVLMTSMGSSMLAKPRLIRAPDRSRWARLDGRKERGANWKGSDRIDGEGAGRTCGEGVEAAESKMTASVRRGSAPLLRGRCSRS